VGVGQQDNHKGTDLVRQRAVFKTEFMHLAGGGADQTELQLKGNADAAW
jgi:hypothetical protein